MILRESLKKEVTFFKRIARFEEETICTHTIHGTNGIFTYMNG